MTEASYTAWDDNEYLWPPPEGWYQSSDGKWWPEGYGPPPVSPEADTNIPDVPPEESIEARSLAPAEPAQAQPEAQVEAEAPFAPPAEDSAPARPQLFDQQPPDGESAGAEGPADGATLYTTPPTGPPVVNVELAPLVESAPETIAASSNDGPSNDGPSNDGRLEFGRSGHGAISLPDTQEILGSKAKGSSRNLWFSIAGAIVLVAVGVGLYLILGGEEDAAETVAPVATGPGSVNEPHDRASGVVVFYPDGDTDQRWIVEVLEPVTDATVELGGSDSVTFAATKLRIRNESGAEIASVSDLRFDVVDPSGTVIVRMDNQCPAAADDLDFEASVPVGSTVDGTVCWAIPGQDQDLEGLKLGIASPKVQGRIHISLQ